MKQAEMDEISFGRMDGSEIAQVAAIHRAALPKDILPRLGMNFLTKILYPALNASAHAQVIVCREGIDVAGFNVLSFNNQALLKDILKYNFFAFAWYSIKPIFLDFQLIADIFGLLFQGDQPKENFSDFGEVYIIAVNPALQSKGVGKALIQEGMAILAQRKLKGIKIKTAIHNTRWIAYFQKNNWSEIAHIKINKKEYVILALAF
jgi:ribosomal protein S18 acetylase RimI-like enzyme